MEPSVPPPVGGFATRAVHPASTSHRMFDEAALRVAGIAAGTVRLSLGIEDVEDLVADIDRGLAAAAAVAQEGTT